jgi:hypothetical protein
MSRLPPVSLFAASLCLGILGVACAPKIGDDCSSSTDCSQNGDRLCDTTQPGGYCTVFNCEPDTCPEEAQCVAFDQTLDPACVDPQSWARFERTFCMRRCDNDGDCRSGYVCYDMRVQPNPWGAKVVDLSPSGYKICISPSSGPPSSGGLTEVCSPYDGGFPDAASSMPDSSVDASGDTPDDAPEAATVDDSSADAPAEDAAGDAGPDA